MHTYKKAFLGSAFGLIAAGMANAQEDCSTATVISGDGSFSYDRTAALTSAFDGNAAGACVGGSVNGSAGNFDVFFAWTASATNTYNMNVSSEANDNQVSVHAGGDCLATCVLTSDPQSWQLVGVTLGDTYLIQIGSWSTGDTPLAGDLVIAGLPPIPANDDCSTPDVISGEGSFAYDRTSATTSGFDGGSAGAICAGSVSGGSGNRDVFFAWTALAAGGYTVDNGSEGNDTNTSIHLGGDCTATCIQESDPSSQQLLGVLAGDVFLIQIGDWSTSSSSLASGTLDITIIPGPPANDDCATPDVIAGLGTFPYDRTSAADSTFDGNLAGACLDGTNSGGAGNLDVFFQWTAAADGAYSFSNCSEGNDTQMSLHLGGDCTATCVDTQDGNGLGCGFGPSEVIVLGVLTGDVYLVQVGTWSNTSTSSNGPGDLVVGAWVPPNDTCATPDVAGVGVTPFDNTPATTSGFAGFAGACNPGIGFDLFYVFTAPVDADYDINLCGSLFDTYISVHSGADCTATCLAGNDDSCALQSGVLLPGVLTGDTFLIQLGGWNATSNGTGDLTIAFATPPPANNDCSTPDVALEGLTSWDNFFATTSGFDGGDELTCFSPINGLTSGGGPDGGSQMHRDLFWVFTVPCDGDYQFDTENSVENTDTKMSIHTGSDCSATCLASDDDGAVSPNFGSLLVLPGMVGGDQVLIQIGSWSVGGPYGAGDLNITNLTGPCPAGGIAITCDPASPHFAGLSTKLDTSTLGAATPSGLHLEATDGPPGEFGFFLVAATATSSLNVFNGVLCLDAPTARYNALVANNQTDPALNSIGQFDAAGLLVNLAGTSASGTGFDVPANLPYTPAGQLIMPGETWAFQLWHRDQIAPLPNPGSSANFSNVAEVTFP